MSTKNVQKNLLFLLLLASLLISGCTSIPVKGQMTQSEIIRSVSEQIADYDLPAGYSEQFAVDVLGYQLVSMVGETPSCHIYLVQAPQDTEADIEKLKEQARKLEGEPKTSEPRDMRVVEVRTASLRGQEVEVLVSEGRNGDNEPYRQVMSVFDGRGGPALVSVSSPVDRWDWEQVDQFLASLK